jgi:hypothetical protein
MLEIRDAQLKVFERESRVSFEERTVKRLAEKYPKPYASLGEDGAREFVLRSIQSGLANRLYSEGALESYIDIVFEFGENFQRSPDRAWALKRLAHPKLPDYVRMDSIREKFASRTDGRILIRQ